MNRLFVHFIFTFLPMVAILSSTTAARAQLQPDSTTVVATLYPGDAAPSFYCKPLNGDKFFLRDYCGKPRDFVSTPRRVVLLSFWATWCGPCRKEIPELQRIIARYDSSDLSVFLVNVGETEDAVRVFVEEHHYSLPVLLDPYGVAADKYCAKDESQRPALPTVVLIDQEGIIRYIHTGYLDGDLLALEEKLIQVLKSTRK